MSMVTDRASHRVLQPRFLDHSDDKEYMPGKRASSKDML